MRMRGKRDHDRKIISCDPALEERLPKSSMPRISLSKKPSLSWGTPLSCSYLPASQEKKKKLPCNDPAQAGQNNNSNVLDDDWI